MRNIFIDTRNPSDSTHFVLRYTQSEELYIVINPTLAICTPQLCTHYYLFPVVLYYNPLSSTSIRRFTHSVPRCTYTFPRCTRSIALYSFFYLSFAIHSPENCKPHYYPFPLYALHSPLLDIHRKLYAFHPSLYALKLTLHTIITLFLAFHNTIVFLSIPYLYLRTPYPALLTPPVPIRTVRFIINHFPTIHHPKHCTPYYCE